jgi:hypothetical protein
MASHFKRRRMSSPTKIEKTNLEAHVELCAERHIHLVEKLDDLEERIDKLENHLVDIKQHLTDNERVSFSQWFKFFLAIFGILAATVFAFIQAGVFN